MIVPTSKSKANLGFIEALLSIASILKPSTATPSCPVQPPLKFYQTPGGATVIGLFGVAIGVGFSALLRK